MARPGESVPSITPPEGPNGVIQIPPRLLMGPGPANADPRVLAAQSLPLLGHMHPPFFKIMDEIQDGLRYVFQTKSKYVLLVAGSGHAGMEASIANLLEPGETIVVGNHGIWGQRVNDLAERYGAKCVNLEVPPGTTLSYDQIKEAVVQHKPAVLFLCQPHMHTANGPGVSIGGRGKIAFTGDSSTGIHQNLAGLGDLCHENGALLLIDTVCSLGGVPFFADDWGVDCMYSGSQKVLGAPPGAAPFFMSEKAMQKLKGRKTKVASYYFDMNLVGDYWGWYDKRFYHCTGMISNWYGMREALAIVAEQGLEPLWERHSRLCKKLWDGLTALGLEPFVEKPEDRLVTVNTVKIPEGVDWAAVVKNAMETFNLEIAGGLGPSAGKCWRVGIMGYNANDAAVALVIEAFRDGLSKQGKLKK